MPNCFLQSFWQLVILGGKHGTTDLLVKTIHCWWWGTRKGTTQGSSQLHIPHVHTAVASPTAISVRYAVGLILSSSSVTADTELANRSPRHKSGRYCPCTLLPFNYCLMSDSSRVSGHDSTDLSLASFMDFMLRKAFSILRKVKIYNCISLGEKKRAHIFRLNSLNCIFVL